jgi:hypothetical protein
MLRRNLKGEECLDREFWGKSYVFGLRKIVYSQKCSYIYMTYVMVASGQSCVTNEVISKVKFSL